MLELEIIKNPKGAANLGKSYGQDVEPKGTYVIKSEGFTPEGWLEGKAMLNHPLFISVDSNNLVKWKYELAEEMKAKGKRLTEKLMAKGYDALITRYSDGGYGEIILFPNAKFYLNQKEMKESRINSLMETYKLVNEADYKLKKDFSGKKWGAQLIDDKIYQFKSGGHEYILDFGIDQTISSKEYVLRTDIRTKKKEFELVKNESPFDLLSTVKAIIKEVLSDLKEYGYNIRGLKIYYSKEEGEDKNIRAVFFNRAVQSALNELAINYNLSTSQDSRTNKDIFEYIFSEKSKEDSDEENLSEGAKRIESLPEDTGLFIKRLNNGYELVLYSSTDDKVYGIIGIRNYQTSDYFVSYVAAEQGFGVYMYELAMMLLSKEDAGLMPDRSGEIKDKAWNIWKKFYNERADVYKTPASKANISDKKKFDNEEDNKIYNSVYYMEKSGDFSKLLKNAKTKSPDEIKRIFQLADDYNAERYVY